MEEIEAIKPDIFVVNEDGHTPEKSALCERLGIEYKILNRRPHEDYRPGPQLPSALNVTFRIV